jgi:hypothetical protein
MPYKLRGNCVIRTDTGETVKCHDSKRAAQDHLAALRINVSAQENRPARYSGIDFSPPEAVRNAAKRGLALRKEFGRGGLTTKKAGKKGIGSGVARATSLKNGDNVSPETIQRMLNFFNRHEKNKDTPPEEGNGKIAWLLWGGDPGRRWARKVKRQMDRADKTAEAVIAYLGR